MADTKKTQEQQRKEQQDKQKKTLRDFLSKAVTRGGGKYKATAFQFDAMGNIATIKGTVVAPDEKGNNKDFEMQWNIQGKAMKALVVLSPDGQVIGRDNASYDLVTEEKV